jgi:hypothetical protein
VTGQVQPFSRAWRLPSILLGINTGDKVEEKLWEAMASMLMAEGELWTFPF